MGRNPYEDHPIWKHPNLREKLEGLHRLKLDILAELEETKVAAVLDPRKERDIIPIQKVIRRIDAKIKALDKRLEDEDIMIE